VVRGPYTKAVSSSHTNPKYIMTYGLVIYTGHDLCREGATAGERKDDKNISGKSGEYHVCLNDQQHLGTNYDSGSLLKGTKLGESEIVTKCLNKNSIFLPINLAYTKLISF
jgi:hypothetical protein